MKKKLKIALMSLVLIPCLLLLTACSQAINVKDYNLRIKESAEAFYEGYGEKDVVVNFKSTITENSKNYISWKVSETEESADYFDSTTTTEVTQTVTLDEHKVNDALLMNASIVKYEKVTKDSWKHNDDKTAVVEDNSVTETTTTQTYVNDGTTQKVYTVVEVKVDGVVDADESLKEVYTYESSDVYYAAIEAIASRLDSGYFSDHFYMNSSMRTMVELMYGSELEYYKSGKAFGFEGEGLTTEVSVNNTQSMEVDFAVNFGKDKLPKSAEVKVNSSFGALNLEYDVDLNDSPRVSGVYAMDTTCEVSYEASVVAPVVANIVEGSLPEVVDFEVLLAPEM